MDLKNRIKEITFSLVTQYGIVSVTMDHIAKACGISKRTLYENFSDKNSLIVASLLAKHQGQMEKFQEIYLNSPNKLVALLRIYTLIKDTLSSICPSFFMDMERLCPLIASEYKEFRKQHLESFMKVIEDGQREGLFRKELKAEIAATLYFIELHGVRRNLDEFGSNSKYTNVEIYSTYFECYVRGISTPYGIEIFEKYKQENENKF